MGHIPERVEITIPGRNFHCAAPTTGAVEIMTVRIGHLSPSDLDGIIMKTFIQGACVAVPSAIFSPGELAAVSKSAAHAPGFRRDDSELHAALRIILRILFARLVRRARLPVICW